MKLNFLAIFITVCAVACAEQPDSRGYVEHGSRSGSGQYYQNGHPYGQSYGPTYYNNDPGEYYRRRYVPGYAQQAEAQRPAQHQQYYYYYPQQQQQYYYPLQQTKQTQASGYWLWVEAKGKTAGYWGWVATTAPVYQESSSRGYVENPGYHYAQRYAPSHVLNHIPRYIPGPSETKRKTDEQYYEDKVGIEEDGVEWRHNRPHGK